MKNKCCRECRFCLSAGNIKNEDGKAIGKGLGRCSIKQDDDKVYLVILTDESCEHFKPKKGEVK